MKCISDSINGILCESLTWTFDPVKNNESQCLYWGPQISQFPTKQNGCWAELSPKKCFWTLWIFSGLTTICTFLVWMRIAQDGFFTLHPGYVVSSRIHFVAGYKIHLVQGSPAARYCTRLSDQQRNIFRLS